MSSPARYRGFGRLALAGLVGVVAWCLVAPPTLAAEVDFYRDVYPVLKVNCIGCHNKTTTKAALNMETPESMRQGGDSGEGVIPGKSAESLIFQAAARIGELEMPPKGNKLGALALTPAELGLLKAWIDAGARSSVKQATQVVWQPLPAGVIPIYSVAMTRDARFAACGRANQIFLYDLATRQLSARLVDETIARVPSGQSAAAAHRALVQSLAFSPDGTRLASGSFREVKIWRRVTPPTATHSQDAAVVAAVSPDGTQIVCADEQGTMRLIDAASGQTLRSIPTAGQGAITLLSLSPDAAKAAVFTKSGTLSLWNLADGKRIGSNEDLKDVRILTWKRDGQAVATAGDDKVVRIWPLPTGENTELAASKELKGATGAITALEAGIDPAQLIVASADGKVRLWNVPEAKPVRELPVANVTALGLSADGTRLVAGRGDGVVQVWDLAAGKPLIELLGDTETHAHLADLAWTVAAEGLEADFQQQEVSRLDAENKALDERIKKSDETIANVRKELAEKEQAVKLAASAKDAAQQAVDAAAERVAKGAEGKPDAAAEKQHKDAQDKLMAALMAEAAAESASKAVAIHLKDAEAEARNYKAARARNDSTLVLNRDALARAKDAQAKATAETAATKKASAERKRQPLAVRFSADQHTVAAAFNDGSLVVWAVASGRPIADQRGKATTTVSLAASDEGAFIACGADGVVTRTQTGSRWVLERTLGGESNASPFVDRVNAVRFSPDGKILAAGGGEPSRSGDVSVWDVETGKLVSEWKERHADAVLSLDFAPDGQRLASGGADKIARVTELATGKVVNLLEGHTHHVLGVAFRSDGRVLATAGGDGVVIVWDMLSGERKKKVEGWSKEVTSLQFIGATNQIVTSAGDNQVRIVDDTGKPIRAMAKLPEFMQSAASAATAEVIIGGGEDGLLRVWNGTSGQELSTFGADVGGKMPISSSNTPAR